MDIFDLIVRIAGGTLNLVIALLLLRASAAPAARLGALFALGVAGYLGCSSPGFLGLTAAVQLPLLALCIANPWLFWLFARALFQDGFRPHLFHAVPLAVLLACGFARWLELIDPAGPLHFASVVVQQLTAFALILHALFVAWSGRADDLLEPRRRVRLWVVAGVGALMLITIAAELVLRSGRGPDLLNTGYVGLITLVSLLVLMNLVRLQNELLIPASAPLPTASPARPAGGSDPGAADADLLARLDVLMAEEVWREAGLTIAALAGRLGAGEHQLRRAINQGRGHRNFNAFLNRYRIAAAQQALADPGQAHLPVLTIAMDLGYGSIGPFNRAFREATGTTPTAWRRDRLGREPPNP